MVITAALVRKLRERSGSGIMECKKALVKSNGDIEAAVEAMRKSGSVKADKKLDRITAEGLIVIKASTDGKHAIMLEINSETDFVAKADDFIDFVNQLSVRVLEMQPSSLEELMALSFNEAGESVEIVRQSLVAKFSENIQVRRFSMMSTYDGVIGTYSHGGRMGTMVRLKGGDDDLANNIAMHIVANSPLAIAGIDLPKTLLQKERNIITAQARDSGKPEAIIKKMIEGRMKKLVNEISLLGQAFVKDPNITINELVNKKNASIEEFQLFKVGSGIEVKQTTFAEEVMEQAKGH